ncbi:tetratricopeptide repeat protein [Streptomyces litchfieldiae]|uniref:Tetratricopeptide repeat protein n=1 Tax=Streptomyces litchfieldiae TaxID=3075543 RepID=A0ABU2MZV0_9ACTN|nr:tetratricopeptide repeat protein [Streptomyces sp. DSM 44938]MDT0346044.1 tetratricopeptide repeat protein [Streptomyces sp. DSM 44938]
MTINQAAPAAPVAWPQQIGVIPRQAHCFQHRHAVDALDAAVAGGETAVLCQILSGTGGVGKTQLAAHYARRRWEAGELDLLVWISAGTRDAIVSAYARAGRRVAGADGEDPEEAAERFLHWLRTTGRRWLVVLDDLVAPREANGLWPPRRPTGRTVATTRRRDAALTEDGRCVVNVGLFTPAEAGAYLATTLAARGVREDPEQLVALAQDLGYLPLALAQAAAYIVDRPGLGCADYRERLADRRRTLADVLPEEEALPDEQRTVMAATWSLSVERADQLKPVGLARPMLRLASMLDANGIPAAVLTSPAALEYVASCRPGGLVDEDAARDALRCLHRLNLVDLVGDGGEGGVRTHGMIQRATRDELSDEEADRAVTAAAQALLEGWPEVEQETGGGVLRANAEALQANAGPRLWTSGVHPVLLQVGLSLERTRFVLSVGAHWRQLRDAAEGHLGRDHPDVLAVRARIAQWRGEAGDRKGAVQEWEDLLADRLRIAGPDHPETLTNRARIAQWRGEAGDRRGAVRAWEELLADRLRLLGPDHKDTLTARSSLAQWQEMTQDGAGAVRTLEDLLADQLRLLGPDHADTLATRARVAELRGQAGDQWGAVEALEQLLGDRERLLGADHPETLATRAGIAEWRGRAGDSAGAVKVLEELLADRERLLGPDHPDTLATRAGVAEWRGRAGDPAGAVEALERLLADRVRLLGPDHADTLATRAGIAEWRGPAGDREGAVRAWEELLADRLRVLGPDHRDTLVTRARIAQWRGRAGAVEALEELLADQLRLLGPDHPDTQSTRAGIAQWRGRAGDPAGAAKALEELLADQLRLLSPDHRATLITRSRIAKWRGRAGDAAGAVKALEELLADQLRILGPEHRSTLIARADVADWRGRAGDREGALRAFEELLADQLRVLGPDHRSTLITRARIAEWRGRTGTPADALAALEDLLADQRRVLKPGHRDTLATRARIAEWRGEAGDRAGAVRELEDLLAEREQLLGPEHPDSQATRGRIAHWRRTRPGAPRGNRRKRPRPAGPREPRGEFYLRWRAADGTPRTFGPFPYASEARQAGTWAANGGGTDIEVVEEPGGPA